MFQNVLEAAHGKDFIQGIGVLLALMFITGLAALVCQRIHFSYSIGLVLLGLAVSWYGSRWGEGTWLMVFEQVRLPQDMLLYLFLPALIFEAALGLDPKKLRQNLAPILMLAAPGVVFATLLTGFLVHLFTPLGWGPAMIFGALISTTDPVAVIAKFRELKAPDRLTMLVDGESLFNDAAAIVLFGILVEIVREGQSLAASTLLRAALEFACVFAGGFVAGLAVGALGCQLIRLGHNLERGLRRVLRVLFSICIAYGSFLLAQGVLGLSGVMAVVGAGMLVSHWVRTRESDRSLYHLREYWNIAAFLVNSMVFLLLGFTEHYLLKELGADFEDNILMAVLTCLVVCLIVLLTRGVLVYATTPLSSRLPGQEPISAGYKAVMVWGGIRGALPVGLAMSLSWRDFGAGVSEGQGAHIRSLIVVFTVSVVVFTLVLQGLTIRALMARFGLVQDGQAPHPSEEPPEKRN